jgi:D-lactate dehydrogenase (cytochrome)
MRPGATSAFITDACVPLPHFAYLIAATAKGVELKGIVGPCFGHASDGNLHCILPLLEDESDEYLAKVHGISQSSRYIFGSGFEIPQIYVGSDYL